MPTEPSPVRHYRWSDLPKEQVTPQLSRRLVTGERMMLAHVYLDKGCVVPKHSHENEQLTYILEGSRRRSTSTSSARPGRSGWITRTATFTTRSRD